MRHHLPILLILSATALLYNGCMPPSDEVDSNITLDARSPEFQLITDFQDKQQTDSLYTYFSDERPTLRYLAARAFASIRLPETVDSLALLLQDPVDRVRAVAAYAIGQTGAASGEDYLLRAFERNDTAGHYRLANRAILEAVGKIGAESTLADLATVSTYEPTDTALLEGQALGIYRYALRNMTNDAGTKRMVQLATDNRYPASARLIAANYLYRAANLKFDSTMAPLLSDALGTSTDPRIRMALVVALGKTKTDQALDALLQQYKQENDYRVRSNLLRALANFPYDSVKTTVRGALKSTNTNEARRAAQFFIEHGITDDATQYWQWAKDSMPWQVQIPLYQAANRHLPAFSVNSRDGINAELRRWYQNSNSVYEKSALIKALAEFSWNYKYLYREGAPSNAPAIRTATMEALAMVSSRKDFRSFFGLGYRNVRRELLGMYLDAMQTGDPGMIAVSAEALRNDNLNFDALISNTSILEKALEELELPKEIETYNQLQQTIAYIKGEELPSPRVPAYNHPIDWAMLNDLSEDRLVTITTNRGDITLEMMPEIAPGTVANFIALVRQGFYQEKAIHRAVPNFVIQGGCPRGDGYGSLDYTIRSELPPVYYDQAGYVGMASAGNHTECTQFFITHSPTPHLDGEYTIFARVTEGLEIVHQTQVGDRIKNIQL
ncbi:MAG: peptidylprolyl isomerase [Phaeodactylibacter sp.]|uniref:peptidylprolyl isomerase n=1 Tax=Phaeodactylibacter sp. TaxID=1940289 RepID=UPI0032EDD383